MVSFGCIFSGIFWLMIWWCRCFLSGTQSLVYYCWGWLFGVFYLCACEDFVGGFFVIWFCFLNIGQEPRRMPWKESLDLEKKLVIL